LFVRQRSETAAEPTLGAPAVWRLRVDFYVYAHSSDPYAPPSSILNPLVDAVEAALAPLVPTGIQNLGLPDMVQRAYLAGRIVTDEGVLRDQIAVVIPVEILCL
jgi:hypothetical protein